jgi:hypothetical protein
MGLFQLVREVAGMPSRKRAAFLTLGTAAVSGAGPADAALQRAENVDHVLQTLPCLGGPVNLRGGRSGHIRPLVPRHRGLRRLPRRCWSTPPDPGQPVRLIANKLNAGDADEYEQKEGLSGVFICDTTVPAAGNIGLGLTFAA